jgi:hypothetical protein
MLCVAKQLLGLADSRRADMQKAMQSHVERMDKEKITVQTLGNKKCET